MAEVILDSLSPGQQVVLKDGDTVIPASSSITNDGSIVVAAGGTVNLMMGGYCMGGTGKIFVEEGATLIILAETGIGLFKGITIRNGGVLYWVGHLQCDSSFTLQNFGELNMDNPRPDLEPYLRDDYFDHHGWKKELKSMYPDNEANWILQQGIVKGAGVFHGNLEGVGLLVLLDVSAPEPPTHGHHCEIPAPSPNYITITGTWAQSSGVINVTINSTYYGQAIIGDATYLGGCTLNVTLDGYTPAFGDNFRIIKAPTITGSIGSFNATAANFDNKGIITLGDGTQAYRLSGY